MIVLLEDEAWSLTNSQGMAGHSLLKKSFAS